MTTEVNITDPMRHRRKRRLRRTFFLGIFAAVLAGMAAANWDLIIGTIEDRAIAAERTTRRTMWAIGKTLPGTPDLAALDQRLAAGGFDMRQPILVRIFKREFELEIWKQRGGRFHRFATYPICRWSGHLGPKYRQGDRQSPEGFYSVSKSQLNPASRWHRSFNLGFPNSYDRAHGRTGSYLMVHGGCSSVGCYAMTDAVVDEIWRLVTAALDAGQHRFQVQAFPFRMTEENIESKSSHPLAAFWRTLKTGADLFEASGIPPQVHVCDRAYQFLPGRDNGTGSGALQATCLPANTEKSAAET